MIVRILLICTFLLFSCQGDRVKVTPTVEDISESVYASGVVKSKHQYEVFSTVNGIIKKILVREGDSVSRGTPLLKISDKTSVLNARNAQLAADYASYNANKEKLDDLKMAVDLAKVKMQNDSSLWQRQQKLWLQNVGTSVELEQKELNYRSSTNSYKSAVIRYKELQRELELNASQSRNIFEINRTIADEYTIRSEIEGKVYKVLKSEGEMANTASPVALVGDDKTFLLELEVDENDIVKVKPGQKVFIGMDSYSGEVFEAVVTHIDPSMNERSRSFNVEAAFTTAPAILYPFLTVEANIVIQTKTDALTIPRDCLVDDSFVITEGNLKKRIVTGLMDYQKVEVISGLEGVEFILQPEE